MHVASISGLVSIDTSLELASLYTLSHRIVYIYVDIVCDNRCMSFGANYIAIAVLVEGYTLLLYKYFTSFCHSTVSAVFSASSASEEMSTSPSTITNKRINPRVGGSKYIYIHMKII